MAIFKDLNDSEYTLQVSDVVNFMKCTGFRYGALCRIVDFYGKDIESLIRHDNDLLKEHISIRYNSGIIKLSDFQKIFDKYHIEDHIYQEYFPNIYKSGLATFIKAGERPISRKLHMSIYRFLKDFVDTEGRDLNVINHPRNVILQMPVKIQKRKVEIDVEGCIEKTNPVVNKTKVIKKTKPLDRFLLDLEKMSAENKNVMFDFMIRYDGKLDKFAVDANLPMKYFVDKIKEAGLNNKYPIGT